MNMMQRMMAIMPGSISCKELDQKLDEYIAGELSAWDWMRFRMHLAICKVCRVYLAGYAKTMSLINGSLDEPDDQDTDVPEELVKAIVAQQTDGPEAQG